MIDLYMVSLQVVKLSGGKEFVSGEIRWKGIFTVL